MWNFFTLLAIRHKLDLSYSSLVSRRRRRRRRRHHHRLRRHRHRHRRRRRHRRVVRFILADW